MNKTSEVTNRLGLKLSEDPGVLILMKHTLDIDWRKHSKLQRLEIFGRVADVIGVPDDIRTPRNIYSIVMETLHVAERFIALQKLANAAGEAEFHPGMHVLWHDDTGYWIHCIVEKVHGNGTYTLSADGHRKTVTDPRNGTTVKVNVGL